MLALPCNFRRVLENTGPNPVSSSFIFVRRALPLLLLFLSLSLPLSLFSSPSFTLSYFTFPHYLLLLRCPFLHIDEFSAEALSSISDGSDPCHTNLNLLPMKFKAHRNSTDFLVQLLAVPRNEVSWNTLLIALIAIGAWGTLASSPSVNPSHRFSVYWMKRRNSFVLSLALCLSHLDTLALCSFVETARCFMVLQLIWN